MTRARCILFSAVCLASGALVAQGQSRHHPALIDAPKPPTTQPATLPHRAPSTHPVPHPIPPAPTPTPPPVPPLPSPPAPPPLPSPQPESHPPVVPDYPRRPAANVNIPRQTRVNIAWQIALESVDFSPGVIDGHFKRKSMMALTEYAARYFPGTTPFSLPVLKSLKVDADDAITTYTITDDDAAQVGGILPVDWNAKARLDRLRYESLVDCITEKFHVSRVLLEALNPGVSMEKLAPDQTLNVPNLRPFPTDNKPTVPHKSADTGSVTVNLGEKAIRVFDKDGREVALFHCSIARDKAKLPAHDTAVKNIAAPNPEYWFDPVNWPEVHNVSRVLTIAAGPRNPVGLAWVSLELPGYGIHGTPKPELIGKTGSHGCFRLTNWDALKFAGLVREGMLVKVVNPERNPE